MSGFTRPDGERWPPTVQRARALVLAHGWNATAYQIVNPGMRHWFAGAGDAVVGYVRAAGVRVVAGAPVCAADRLPDVVDEFELASGREGDGVCYFGAEARLEGALAGSALHVAIALGAQPAWRPAGFGAAIESHASLRAQLRRAANKGVRVDPWPAPGASDRAPLRRVLGEWLAARRLPPLHFLVEPNTLDRLEDRRVFVARRGDAIAGFVVASPIPTRHGWLVEQFVRGRAAVNGTTELMLHTAVRALASDGAAYVTLGLAPLSRHGPPLGAESAWLRLVLRWVRAHGRRFYDFDGLDAFKSKFMPERWEPVYAIARGGAFSPRALWAIAGAFGGQSPVSLVARAAGRALTNETRWLAARATAARRRTAGAD